MKKYLGLWGTVIFTLFLVSCGPIAFNGSRIGNSSKFLMEYSVFNTTDSQDLELEAGDTIEAEITVEGGSLAVRIQKDDEEPVCNKKEITDSGNFEINIKEGGVYTITVTGEKAKGSVSFRKGSGGAGGTGGNFAGLSGLLQ